MICMDLRITDGDLLDQDVEVIVNAWNRNIIPWLLHSKSLSTDKSDSSDSAPPPDPATTNRFS